MNSIQSSKPVVNPLLDWAWKHGILAASPLDSGKQLAATICKGLLAKVTQSLPIAEVPGDTIQTAPLPKYGCLVERIETLPKPPGFELSIHRSINGATISATCTLPGMTHEESMTRGVL